MNEPLARPKRRLGTGMLVLLSVLTIVGGVGIFAGSIVAALWHEGAFESLDRMDPGPLGLDPTPEVRSELVWEHPRKVGIAGMAFTPDGAELLVLDVEGVLWSLDAGTLKPGREVTLHVPDDIVESARADQVTDTVGGLVGEEEFAEEEEETDSPEREGLVLFDRWDYLQMAATDGRVGVASQFQAPLVFDSQSGELVFRAGDDGALEGQEYEEDAIEEAMDDYLFGYQLVKTGAEPARFVYRVGVSEFHTLLLEDPEHPVVVRQIQATDVQTRPGSLDLLFTVASAEGNTELVFVEKPEGEEASRRVIKCGLEYAWSFSSVHRTKPWVMTGNYRSDLVVLDLESGQPVMEVSPEILGHDLKYDPSSDATHFLDRRKLVLSVCMGQDAALLLDEETLKPLAYLIPAIDDAVYTNVYAIDPGETRYAAASELGEVSIVPIEVP